LPLLIDGEYRIRVGTFGGTSSGAFTLTVTQIDEVTVAPQPPAQTITIGQIIDAALPPGGVREYSFDGTAGAMLSVAVTADFDSTVSLRRGGEQIAFDDDSGGNLNALISG